MPLIATLFWHGEFLRHDVMMTRNALVAYAVGLAGIILVKVLAPGFYAKQNVRTPVKIAIATLVVTQLLNAAFVPVFRHAGLALSISVGACFNAAWLWYLMRRSGAYQPEPGWGAFLLKLAVALYLMGGALWYAMGSESSWFEIAAGARALKLAARHRRRHHRLFRLAAADGLSAARFFAPRVIPVQILRHARPEGETAIAVGSFDGVHLGHRAMLERVGAAAASRGLQSAILTLRAAPREYFARAQAPARISSLGEKLAAVADLGIGTAFVERFAGDFAAIRAEDFAARLREHYGARWVMVGPDFRYGAGRKGDAASLAAAGREHGFEVEHLPAVNSTASACRAHACAKRSPRRTSSAPRACWAAPMRSPAA